MFIYVLLILQLVTLVLGTYWMKNDVEKKGLDKKFFWIWFIVAAVGLFLLGIVGIGAALFGYYLWTKTAHTSGN